MAGVPVVTPAVCPHSGPLAIHIRASQNIVGFQRGPRQDVVSLYADDTLIYLGDTDSSLQNVMNLIAIGF